MRLDSVADAVYYCHSTRYCAVLLAPRYYLAASTGRVHMWTRAHVCEGAVEASLSLLCAMGGGLGMKRAPGYRLFPGMYVTVRRIMTLSVVMA